MCLVTRFEKTTKRQAQAQVQVFDTVCSSLAPSDGRGSPETAFRPWQGVLHKGAQDQAFQRWLYDRRVFASFARPHAGIRARVYGIAGLIPMPLRKTQRNGCIEEGAATPQGTHACVQGTDRASRSGRVLAKSAKRLQEIQRGKKCLATWRTAG